MMPLPPFELMRPASLEEALDLLKEGRGGARILAGGTDLLPNLKHGLGAPDRLISLAHILPLKEITARSGELRLGAMVRLAELNRSAPIRAHLPALAAAASSVGTPIIQNMGTLGGNLLLDTRCVFYNQSAPWREALGYCLKKEGDLCHVAPGSPRCLAAFSGDTAVPLLLYDADVRLHLPTGVRRIPLAELYRSGDGARWLTLAPGEILGLVCVPRPAPGWRVAYAKLRLRQSIDYALGSVGVGIERRPDGAVARARAVLGSLGSHPIEVPGFGAPLLGRPLKEGDLAAAGELAARAAQPLGTHLVEPGYRQRLVRVEVRRMLERMAAE